MANISFHAMKGDQPIRSGFTDLGELGFTFTTKIRRDVGNDWVYDIVDVFMQRPVQMDTYLDQLTQEWAAFKQNRFGTPNELCGWTIYTDQPNGPFCGLKTGHGGFCVELAPPAELIGVDVREPAAAN